MLVITTENIGKDQKIWYNLHRHAKSKIVGNQEKRIFKEVFLASKTDNKQKFLFSYKEEKVIKKNLSREFCITFYITNLGRLKAMVLMQHVLVSSQEVLKLCG